MFLVIFESDFIFCSRSYTEESVLEADQDEELDKNEDNFRYFLKYFDTFLTDLLYKRIKKDTRRKILVNEEILDGTKDINLLCNIDSGK